jgi:hypothetical protein
MYYAVYIAFILIGIGLIVAILQLLVKKKLSESNAILWMCIGIFIILAGIFPKVIFSLSNFFFITYPPAFVFTIAIIILLLIVLRNTIINSELAFKMQETAMEASILRQELFETKKQVEKLQLHIEKENGREE